MPKFGVRLLALAVLAAAVPAFADATITTRTGAVNSLGEPVSASAEFTIHQDGIVVKLTNTSPQLSSYHQTLRGISFSVAKREAKGTLGFTRGLTRTISGSTVVTSSDEQVTKWTLSTKDNVYTLTAPAHIQAILPDAEVTNADKSITDAPADNPFLTGSCLFQVLTPTLDLSDDIVGVKFLWADDVTQGEPKVATNPEEGTRNSGSDAPPAFGGGGGGVGGGGGGSNASSLGGAPDVGGGGGSGSGSTAAPAATQPTTPAQPVQPAPLDLAPIFEAPIGKGPNAPLPPDATTFITPPANGAPNPPLPVSTTLPGTDSITDPTTPADTLGSSNSDPLVNSLNTVATAIPEPMSVSLLALGTGVLLLRRPKRIRD